MSVPSFRHLRRGFTLVELLIVIIIIAVLAAIAIPKFANSSARSKESALKSTLKIARNAVEIYRADTGAYPPALADLATAPGTPPAGYKGPYVNVPLLDPVSGNDLTYTVSTGIVKPSATGVDSNNVNYTSY